MSGITIIFQEPNTITIGIIIGGLLGMGIGYWLINKIDPKGPGLKR